MDPVEQKVRADHPDWSDEQVAAEVTARKAKPDPEPDPKDPPQQTERDAAFARMRREKEDADKRAREAEQKLAKQEREKAEAQGQWEQLAKQYEGERDAARQELADLRTEIRIKDLAKDMKFRHADEAIALLPRDVDRSDEGAVRVALQTLADERKHLIDSGTPGPTGRPNGGSTTGLTVEQIKQMSPEEVNRRWDEVQPILAQQQT